MLTTRPRSQPSASSARRRDHQRFPRNPTPHRRHPSPTKPRRIQRRRLRPAQTGSSRSQSAAEPAVPAKRERQRDGRTPQGAIETVCKSLKAVKMSSVSDGLFSSNSHSIIIDAAVRRHRAQKAFLRATAALRWMNARAAVLQGHRAQEAHEPALQQIRNALRLVSCLDPLLFHPRKTKSAKDRLPWSTLN